jgi:peptidoglycan hydrolase CwlO-like protein
LLIKEKDRDVEEMQMKTLHIKSQIIDKDGQINDLMETLASKGEEMSYMSSQYLELKNYILD